jgi:coenzyme Q-binding protein COQ10
MASASTSEIFNCSVEEFYKIITDYDRYPEFLDEVKNCKVVEKQGDKWLVEYQINVIKSFKYSLWMDHSKPNQVSWTFAGGDLFKESKGSWVLENEAGKTRALYTVEAKFSMFVPGPLTKGLIAANLPNMMSAYTRRVKELYGK